MRKTIQTILLASMASVSLLAGAPVSTASAAQLTKVVGVQTYLIEFDDPGALHYSGGVGQLRPTAADPLGIGPFNPGSQDVAAYRAYLRERQDFQVAQIAAAIGHPIDVTHTFEITHSGVAAKLTAQEVAKITRMPGIKSIHAEQNYHMDTYRGPTFIGAPTIWNATPIAPVNRGKGVVIGVLDSGANSTHPSFADDATCGFGPFDHKLLSARDCSATTAGVCSGPTPEAVASGHGVHTASTAGGNTVTNSASPSPVLPAPATQMSGVAPCASIRTYKVCNNADGSCAGADITAAINDAIADSVGVINFSISGGTSPWSTGESDRGFLDAVAANVFVAASAGNTSATITNPVGQVNHRGPWVMTVAASTQDQNLGPALSATGPGTPPAATQGILTALGSHITSPVPFTNLPIRNSVANPTGCTASGGFPAGFFTGSVALISRGTCTFVEKVANAAAAGAQQAFIFNNTFGSINMNTDGSTIPAYSMVQTAGVALSSFITANGATPTTVTLISASVANVQGDVLADFSFRGPTPGALVDLTKPDITGPGVNIFAAGRAADGNYFVLSGTSMSSPHVAGSAALVRAQHPFWTPAEVKSALQMTASIVGVKENTTDPWNVDDVGNGRVDLTKASAAGLVMNETFANYLAANPTGGSINVKALNIPSVRNMNCNGACPVTRKLTSKLGASSTWTVTYVGATSFALTVTPATFTIPAGGSQVLTITPNVSTPVAAPAFGYIVLTPSNLAQAPVERITVAIKGQGIIDHIFTDGFEGGPAGPACLSVNARTSAGEFGSGDAANSIVSLNIGAGNAMTGTSADASIEAFDPSWLSDAEVTFSSSDGAADPNAINLTMSVTDAPGIELNDTTNGVLLFADFSLPNVVAGADGILRLEWNEVFSDPEVTPNTRWTTPTVVDPAGCPGLHITCTNQAACDAAVNAALRH